MLNFLKYHPFSVETKFQKSIVLTFAIPKKELENLIPECLELDIYDNKWAFIAVAMVETKNLRPKGFPNFMGNNFFLIGYRIFVRYTNNKGKKLRGLYILKSETDKKKMEFFGNLFTHYNYTTTDINVIENKNSIEIKSTKSNFLLKTNMNREDSQLPKNSPFPTWKIARRYAGPLPFTFTYNDKTKEVLIVEGVRQNWIPKPIDVSEYNFSFFKTVKIKEPILANAFVLENIPYYWKKGHTELWKS